MMTAVVLMGTLGVLVGICLAAASKIFYVWVDPKIEAVEAALPGANCGGCGMPGCSANAEAIVTGKAAPNSCVAAGDDVAEAIAAILGVSVEAKEPDIARPGCTYGVQSADTKFLYDGVSDCRAAAVLGGGMKVCTIGCLGLGSCEKACPFGAISMGADGLPVVSEALCTGCGTCERVCPKHIITLSSVTRRILREYTIEECTTPCQRACPAGINISEYIRQVGLGDHLKAVQVIKERNPFPAVIGRICPRPCEEACRRKYVDEPVAINYLKRFAADFERSGGQRVQPYCAPATGRRVAIVGGGVEGLSTAFFSARLGHAVTVYEAADTLGGLLRTAIARERLPMDVLDWDIGGILDLGVTAETGKKLGRDVTIAGLLADGHEAVFLAGGGWDSRLARGAVGAVDDTVPGTYLLMDYLRSHQHHDAGLPTARSVVIAAPAAAGIAAARQCRANGAETVTVVARAAEQAGGVDADTLAAAEADGIRCCFGAAVNRLSGSGNRLAGLDIVHLSDGRIETVAAQMLLLAAGRMPELVFRAPRPSGESVETVSGNWEGITPYKPPAFAADTGLFGPGDVMTDFSGAIRAIAAGRRAAASLHRLIYDIGLGLGELVVTDESQIQNVSAVHHVAKNARRVMPLRGAAETMQGKEIEAGYSPEAALAEAHRCLQCGLICYSRESGATEFTGDTSRSAA
ncbi:MAG: (Fe-S)-binding protein [Pseudomonadota bacterium]